MNGLGRQLRGLLLLLSGFGLTGCPALLDDNFVTLPADSGGTGGIDAGSGRGGKNSNVGASDSGPDAGSSEGGASGLTTGGAESVSGSGSGGTLAIVAGAGGESGAAGAAPTCGGDSCKPTETCCDDGCVDTRFDAANCRICGHGCPGTTCDGSSCTNTCAQGFIDCNRNVVDGCEVNPAIDPKNCGNCGIQCGFQLECVEGYCVCPAGTADCDGVKDNGCETDISSDKASCGACGKACGTNEACADGKCGCAVGFLDCNGLGSDGCEASVTAASSCGSCSLDCGQHGTCLAAGQCGCASGYLNCDPDVPGCETPTSDPQHCGSCDVSCPLDLPACDGTSCNLGCNGLTACGSSCVDTQVNPENCGGCGKVVGTNQVCVGGKPTCAAGFADCDQNPNDCEVDTRTDSQHCGSCNGVCKAGAECQSGSCGCSPATPNDCGAACQQCCSDSQCTDGDSCTADLCNAGVCVSSAECAGGGSCCAGTGCFECCSDGDCALGKVCTGNKCVNLTCSLPQIACSTKCVNPTNDASNCGGCGNSCGKGRSCASSACTPRWVSTAPPLAGFVAREKAAYAALGDKVFIWGGADSSAKNLADGALYDPASDTWSALPSTGSPPSARVLATAVWTGSVMVVWGGGDAANTVDYNTGSRFDPATNSWSAMTTLGAPSGRRAAYGFWTGSRVLFFAGSDKSINPVAGAYLYDPVNDKWSAASSFGQPSARLNPTAGWSGTELLVYGGAIGANNSQSTYSYDLASNSWTRVNDGPSARAGAFGTWDGAYLLAWSGNGNGFKSDGKLYEPVGDKWTNMGTSGEPSARWAPNRYTGWSFRIKPHLALFVGGSGNSFATDGGMYNSTTNGWTSISAWPSGASHIYGAAVWTGTELVMWGGRTGTAAGLTSAGERYLP
ncbi:MAG TPA: kelch repeat-containing protein [Polyangiaceae bacterium]|nr:kelch repeat-containing protein [Polyangiaceae bacterium]